MSKRDYYEVLGVEKGADQKEIKKAYRRLAQKRTGIKKKLTNNQKRAKNNPSKT